MKQTIRIIGGQFRGKKLHFPDIAGLRPTPDRVRETLFNWLMHDIQGAHCLDAFAGSGALGFEAFSRGASNVVLVEQSPIVHANLIKQTTEFNSSNVIVVKDSAMHYLKQTKESFDIIFLDPPFAANYLPECLKLIEESNLLASNGLLYLETDKNIALDAATWQLLKQKKAGQVIYGLYKNIT